MNLKGDAWTSQQVKQYKTLSLLRTARWQATAGILLFSIFFLAYSIYHEIPPSRMVIVLTLITALGFLAHRGRRWAIIVVMAYLGLQMITMFDHLTSLLIWYIAVLVPLYRSCRVEKARQDKFLSPSSIPPQVS